MLSVLQMATYCCPLWLVYAKIMCVIEIRHGKRGTERKRKKHVVESTLMQLNVLSAISISVNNVSIKHTNDSFVLTPFRTPIWMCKHKNMNDMALFVVNTQPQPSATFEVRTNSYKTHSIPYFLQSQCGAFTDLSMFPFFFSTVF